MSTVSEIDRFIDGLNTLSLMAQIDSELRDVRAMDAKRCGNCQHWMKSRSCPREHNVNGRSRGPSCNEFGCEKFLITPHVVELKKRRLEELKARYDALKAKATP